MPSPSALYVGASRGNTPWAHMIHLATVAHGYRHPWTFKDGPATHVFVGFAWETATTVPGRAPVEAMFEALPPVSRWTVAPLPRDPDVRLWQIPANEDALRRAWEQAHALNGVPYDLGSALLQALGAPGDGFRGAEICTEVMAAVLESVGGQWVEWASAYRRGVRFPERAVHMLDRATGMGHHPVAVAIPRG